MRHSAHKCLLSRLSETSSLWKAGEEGQACFPQELTQGLAHEKSSVKMHQMIEELTLPSNAPPHRLGVPTLPPSARPWPINYGFSVWYIQAHPLNQILPHKKPMLPHPKEHLHSVLVSPKSKSTSQASIVQSNFLMPYPLYHLASILTIPLK